MKFNDTDTIYTSVATGTAERKETASLASCTELHPVSLIYCTQITQYSLHDDWWSQQRDIIKKRLIMLLAFEKTAQTKDHIAEMELLQLLNSILRCGVSSVCVLRTSSVWLQIGSRSPVADGSFCHSNTPTIMMSKRRKMATPHAAMQRRFCQTQQTSHSWLTLAGKFTEILKGCIPTATESGFTNVGKS